MCRSDNFGVLVHDDESGRDGAHRRARGERRSWPRSSAPAGSPTLLLITHHHGDHVEANLALKQKFELTIIGPEAEAAKIPGIDADGERRRCDPLRQGDHHGDRDAGPHGRPCLLSSSPASDVVFTADTLFALGCGRLLECKPPVMYRFAEEARGAAARNEGLLRPRIHAGQRPLRADRRSRPIRR